MHPGAQCGNGHKNWVSQGRNPWFFQVSNGKTSGKTTTTRFFSFVFQRFFQWFFPWFPCFIILSCDGECQGPCDELTSHELESITSSPNDLSELEKLCRLRANWKTIASPRRNWTGSLTRGRERTMGWSVVLLLTVAAAVVLPICWLRIEPWELGMPL